MKNKKYSKVMLYQVFPVFGTVKEGMTISQIDEGFNDLPVISSVEFQETIPIIVEKYSPFLVREVITGLAFPIVNVHAISSKLNSMYYVEKPIQEACAFVISRGERLISIDIDKADELEKYKKQHPDESEFKQYLQQIRDVKKKNTNFSNSIKRRVLTTK